MQELINGIKRLRSDIGNDRGNPETTGIGLSESGTSFSPKETRVLKRESTSASIKVAIITGFFALIAATIGIIPVIIDKHSSKSETQPPKQNSDEAKQSEITRLRGIIYDGVNCEKPPCDPKTHISERAATVIQLVKLAGEKRVDLQKADLAGANLGKVDFYGADLRKANFRRATLSEANLEKANLAGSYLFKAIIFEANLAEANLRSAILGLANLEGAHFWRAFLKGSFLKGSNLEKAKLLGAYYDSTTIFPDGFNPRIYGMVELE